MQIVGVSVTVAA